MMCHGACTTECFGGSCHLHLSLSAKLSFVLISVCWNAGPTSTTVWPTADYIPMWCFTLHANVQLVHYLSCCQGAHTHFILHFVLLVWFALWFLIWISAWLCHVNPASSFYGNPILPLSGGLCSPELVGLQLLWVEKQSDFFILFHWRMFWTSNSTGNVPHCPIRPLNSVPACNQRLYFWTCSECVRANVLLYSRLWLVPCC